MEEHSHDVAKPAQLQATALPQVRKDAQLAPIKTQHWRPPLTHENDHFNRGYN